MCRLVEEYGNERAKESSTKVREENAKCMLSDGIRIEKVAEYSGLSLEEVQKLAASK